MRWNKVLLKNETPGIVSSPWESGVDSCFVEVVPIIVD